jgi:hypothetical protein
VQLPERRKDRTPLQPRSVHEADLRLLQMRSRKGGEGVNIKKYLPYLILNGKIDVVIEWRSKNWKARAWGVSIGQCFLGLITFHRIKDVQP